MSQEIYLRLDGIQGEAKKSGVDGWIELQSFSNGITNHSNVAKGTGSGSGKVDPSSISCHNQIDASTPKLALALFKGTHIAKGTIIVRESTGDTTTQTYFQYDLTQVYVDSMSWGAAEGGGAKVSQSFGLSFDKITIMYYQQNPDGSLKGVVQSYFESSTNTAG